MRASAFQLVKFDEYEIQYVVINISGDRVGLFGKLKSTGKLYGDGALEEVHSEKQRRWACAQIDNPTKLTKSQAKEMCSGPSKK